MRSALFLLLLFCGCRCPGQPAAPDRDPDPDDPADRPSSLAPPARQPGPPRAESDARVVRALEEAAALVQAMGQGGVSRREAASMADIRGYRLFKRRLFGQARAWFETAVRADPTFEPAIFNAARAAAAAGDASAARDHLRRLRRLGTPLARSRLGLARQDPDLRGLWR